MRVVKVAPQPGREIICRVGEVAVRGFLEVGLKVKDVVNEYGNSACLRTNTNGFWYAITDRESWPCVQSTGKLGKAMLLRPGCTLALNYERGFTPADLLMFYQVTGVSNDSTSPAPGVRRGFMVLKNSDASSFRLGPYGQLCADRGAAGSALQGKSGAKPGPLMRDKAENKRPMEVIFARPPVANTAREVGGRLCESRWWVMPMDRDSYCKRQLRGLYEPTNTPPQHTDFPQGVLQELFIEYAGSSLETFLKRECAELLVEAMDWAIHMNHDCKDFEFDTLGRMIRDAVAYEELLDQFVALAVATEGCGKDRGQARYLINQMAIAWIAHSISRGAYDGEPEEGQAMIMQVLRHQVLDKHAAAIALRNRKKRAVTFTEVPKVKSALLDKVKEDVDIIAVGFTACPIGWGVMDPVDVARVMADLNALEKDKSARLEKSKLWREGWQRQAHGLRSPLTYVSSALRRITRVSTPH